METYARPAHPEGVSEAIEQDIARLAATAGALTGAARHVEVFRACAS
jgi:hypothetical protein